MRWPAYLLSNAYCIANATPNHPNAIMRETRSAESSMSNVQVPDVDGIRRHETRESSTLNSAPPVKLDLLVGHRARRDFGQRVVAGSPSSASRSVAPT